MRTILQLAFTFIIAFSMVSCGGDAKSPDNANKTTSAEDNSTKPIPTFKMSSGKNDTKVTKPNRQNISSRNNTLTNNAKNTGGFTSNPISAKPSNTNTKPKISSKTKLTDGQILAGVPNACSLVSVDEIAKIVGVSASDIRLKDASHTKSPFTRSCFFRWDGASPNTGILIQVQANPIQEEYAEWVSLFVSSKRTIGEKAMGTNETFKYEKMEGLGDDGSYSHRLGKYFWRDGNKYAFMIAFNTNSAKKLQMKNAKTIGNIMMKNYNNL